LAKTKEAVQEMVYEDEAGLNLIRGEGKRKQNGEWSILAALKYKMQCFVL
jgi:hypothetical protein